MLSSRKSNPAIEIENRHAVDASLSLSEISHVQPGPVLKLHTHTQSCMILGPPPLTLHDVHPGVPTSCRLKYPNPPPRPPITERMRDEAQGQAIRERFVVGSLLIHRL